LVHVLGQSGKACSFEGLKLEPWKIRSFKFCNQEVQYRQLVSTNTSTLATV